MGGKPLSRRRVSDQIVVDGHVERSINRMAASQRGNVTRAQLKSLGLGGDAIDYRLRTGHLRLMFRGVYLVGPIAPPGAREMAAVLACGGGAVLSHFSAATRWKLLRFPARDAAVDITLPRRRLHQRAGIRLHYVLSAPADELTRVDGIPITSPARTLLDVAAALPPAELEQSMAQAERRHLTSRTRLATLLARYPARRGTRALRSLLEAPERPALTRSEAERRFLALIRRARLPAPATNASIGQREVDFLWRRARLVVEVDGFAFHSDRAAFEADRLRDAELVARGLTVIRITWRQIADEPEALLVRLAGALARRGG